MMPPPPSAPGAPDPGPPPGGRGDLPRIAIVIHRYGPTLGGGAEEHARHLVRALQPRAAVEVLTTCARDHHTWENHFPPGLSEDEGAWVRRFPTARRKNRGLSFALSRLLFALPHPVRLEDLWLDLLGPHSPELLQHIENSAADYRGFIFYTYLYPTTVRGLRRAGSRALLIPTAHDEPMLRLRRHQQLLESAPAFGFLTPEERDLVLGRIGAERAASVPAAILGGEIDDSRPGNAAAFRAKFDIDGRFFLYLGRIERSKGCGDLFRMWMRRRRRGRRPLLLLAGRRCMPIPRDPSIQEIGFLSEEDKANAIAASDGLIQPSRRESLSLVILEAWARGRPVIADERCPPVAGQVRRSGGGILYRDRRTFQQALERLADPEEAAAIGEKGRSFHQRECARGSLARRLIPFLERLGWIEAADRIPQAAGCRTASP